MTSRYSSRPGRGPGYRAVWGELGWVTANCFYDKVGDEESTLGRRTTQEVVLLRAALPRLNSDIPDEAIEETTTRTAAHSTRPSLSGQHNTQRPPPADAWRLIR